MQSNSNSSAKSKQDHSKPSFAFRRGVYVPLRVWQGVLDHKVTTTDLAILAVIDQLSGGDEGPGCFATNAYIGRSVGVTKNRISHCLGRLQTLGLLRIQQELDRRYIWVIWTPPEVDGGVVLAEQGGCSGRTRGGCSGRTTISNTSGITKNKCKQTLSTGAKRRVEGAAEPTTNGKAQTLSPTPAKIKETDPTAVDYKWADLLHDAVARKAGITRGWSQVSWAKEFMRLRTAVPPVRIGRALSWYCKHISDKYVPQIWSAKKFRLEFHRVEAAVKRDTGEDPDIEITDAAKDIVTTLKNYTWPKDSARLLPQAVQVSLTNFRKFHKLCKRLAEKYDQPGERDGTKPYRIDPRLTSEEYLAYKITVLNPDISYFVKQWFKDLNQRVQRWSEWSGRLMDQVVSTGHKEFNKTGRRWAKEACSKESVWDKLLEVIYGCGT